MPRPFLGVTAAIALLFAGLPLASVFLFGAGNSGSANDALTATLQRDSPGVDASPSLPVAYGIGGDGRLGCDHFAASSEG